MPSALLWLATAIWLYTPFSARPYDILDFANFLPILRTSTSVVDGALDLTRYYADNHGRFNVGAFALLSIKWRLFGENMLGWQLFRLGEMCLLASLLFLFLRRLRVSYAGAFAATLIVLASPTAAANWMIMSVTEPPGTVCLLILMLLLTGGSAGKTTRFTLVLLALLTVSIGLLKEMLLTAVVIPAIVLSVGATLQDGRLRALWRSPQLRIICISWILVAIPIIWFALDAPATSYSRKFGAQTTPFNAFMPAFAILVPFAPAASGGVPTLLALSAYLVVLISGLGLLIHNSQRTEETLRWVTLGLGLSLSGVVAYSPWPSFSLIYALPFQVGTAALVGLAITAIGKRLRASTPILLASGALMVAILLTSAQEYARFRTVSLRMSHDLALHLGTLDPARDVYFEVCGPSEKLWQNYGLLITGYATSLGLAHPEMIDAPCHTLSPRKGESHSGGHVILSNELLPQATGARVLSYTYRSMDWSAFTTRRHTLQLTMLHPSGP